MSSSGGGIGSTLTGGIQDVAAILPLLGTEQCSVQVSSALTRGYLYAAASPMSIFGSLGVVTAGFKTLIACFSFGDIEGAKVRHCLLASHSGVLKEQRYLGIWDSSRKERIFR
jgi:hypothetical protein